MKIAVVGLGYVGLPLAAAFSEKYEVVGFDVNAKRIEELKSGYDRTLELSNEQMKKAIDNGMKFSLNLDDIRSCNFFIVTVPTPIDKNKRLKKATSLSMKAPFIQALQKKFACHFLKRVGLNLTKTSSAATLQSA